MMNEWSVVTVLVVLVGLLATLVKPIVKLNTSLEKNTLATEVLTETIKDNEIRNKEEHGEIWEELDEHDRRLSHIEKGAK